MKLMINLHISLRGRLLTTLILIILLPASLSTVTSLSLPSARHDSVQALAAKSAYLADFSKQPLSFEPNLGQTNLIARYLTHIPNGTIFFTPNEVILALSKLNNGHFSSHTAAPMASQFSKTVSLRFIASNPASIMTTQDLLASRVNYFLGDDPKQWHSNVPTYSKLVYESLYPGINLSYIGTNLQLKGTYTVAPHSDPTSIHWRYDNAQQVTIANNGNLLIDLNNSGDALVEEAPIAWQQIGEQRVAISVKYIINPDSTIGFVLGSYDHNYTLMIDPALVYSTFLGGSDFDEGWSIVADWQGNIYITGFTSSSVNFPLQNATQPQYGGGTKDAFVTKLSAAGSELIYSTFLGGSLEETGYSIAVDTNGNVYVTGRTNSTNFPRVRAFQNSYGGYNFDGFVTKLDANGQLGISVSGTYSTYLGGNGGDEGHGIAVDNTGNAYITGFTGFTLGLGGNTFPKTANAYQPICGGCENNNYTDAFITKISGSGSLLYSSYLGGAMHEGGKGIAVDSANNAYIVGYTNSSNFPTRNAYQPSLSYGFDGFVTKLDAAGSPHLYSTYLGGHGDESGYGVAVDSSNKAYVTGYTGSTDFPVQSPYQPSNHGQWDAFVTKFNSLGTGLDYSTYLGGSNQDEADSIAVTSDGHAVVSGQTYSSNDFPLVQNLQPGFGGGYIDAFVTKLNPSGAALDYSTYLGGTGDEGAQGVAVDGYNNAYITGWTWSSNYPTRIPYQPNFAGADEGFISKVSDQSETAPPIYTNSYYIQSSDTTRATQLGCDARARGETGVVLLHFGFPRIISINPTVYGTQLHNTSTQMNLDQIKDLVIAFATGYAKPFSCLIPPPYPSPNLIIAAGVSSSAVFSVPQGHYIDNSALTYYHGAAWGSMINATYSKLHSDSSYSGITVAGAYDAEYYQSKLYDTRNPFTGLRSGSNDPNDEVHQWSIYSYTKTWSEGYDSTQPTLVTAYYYDIGSCEDCKRVGSPSTWTASDLDIFSRVHHVAWEPHSALALPQIYFEQYNYEWYNVRWYVKAVPGTTMTLSGATTGCRADPPCTPVPVPVRLQPRFNQACHPQTACIPQWTPYNCASSPCPYLPPSVGWQALGDMLSSPNGPEGTPVPSLGPQPSLPYGPTDIIYQP